MTKLFQAQYPATRPKWGVWVSVLLAHLLLVWLINLYWPVQRIISQVMIQIFTSNTAGRPELRTTPRDPKTQDPESSAPSADQPRTDAVESAAMPEPVIPEQRGITFRRSLKTSSQLGLAPLIAEVSTPLQATAQQPKLKPSLTQANPSIGSQQQEVSSSSNDIVDKTKPINETTTLASTAPVPPAPVPPAPVPPAPVPPAPVPPAPVPPAPVPPAPVPPAPIPPAPIPPAPIPPAPTVAKATSSVATVTVAPASTETFAPQVKSVATLVSVPPAPPLPPAPRAAALSAPAPTQTALTPTALPTTPTTATTANISATVNVASPVNPKAVTSSPAAGAAPNQPANVTQTQTGVAPNAGQQGATSGAAVGAATGSTSGSPNGSPNGSPSGNPSGVVGEALPRPPLNLSLPRNPGASGAVGSWPNRAPLNAPRRSLSEMANEQLGVKGRDRLADGVEKSSASDCLRGDSPGADGKIGDVATGGLLNAGPLLKRIIEEKCAK